MSQGGERPALVRSCRRLFERLTQPSSAAGLAALLALLVPRSPSMPAIVDLALTLIAVGAALVAMVKCECRDCNGR
jgi:hypothetical protein